jgi:hypothetical protein
MARYPSLSFVAPFSAYLSAVATTIVGPFGVALWAALTDGETDRTAVITSRSAMMTVESPSKG